MRRVDAQTPAVASMPYASSFVGRRTDLEGIATAFENGAQLVTVTGLGGMGKTRLAEQFAAAYCADYQCPGSGGLWFCDLTNVHDPLTACAVVASVVGVQLGTDEALLPQQLGRALAQRGRLLLILDNFEQLAGCADAIVGRLMRVAPRARFLVTSRVALRLPLEQLWPLDPLRLPSSTSDEASLATIDSVRLFLSRAHQVRPGFRPQSGELQAVAEIVQRLDGIPLAIELAAARLTVLSVVQLRQRLAHSLELLVRSGEGRHASMRRTIADTWSQLGRAAQQCLAGCTVFAGSFSLEAAEAVLSPVIGPVLPVLETLCLHSLVRATPRAELAGEIRFSLFETIREFAEEHVVATTATAQFVDRHARFFADLACKLAVPAAVAGGQAATRLAFDLDNFVAAHRRMLADPASRPLAIAGALGAHNPLIRRGMVGTAKRLLDSALGRDGSLPGSTLVGNALIARGQAQLLLGARRQTLPDFERALALAQQLNDPTLEARARMHIGEIIELVGTIGEAHTYFEGALACFERVRGNPLLLLHKADVHTRIAHAYRREGKLECAQREIQRAIGLHRRAAHSDSLPLVYYEAAIIAWFRSSYEEALQALDEGLALVQARDVRGAHGALLYARAILLQERGQLDPAFENYVRALELIRGSGNLYLEASATYYFAGAHLERGQYRDAATLLERALSIFLDIGVPRYQALVEGCRATLFALGGERECAQRSLKAAEKAASACASEQAVMATVAIHKLYINRGSQPDSHDELLEQARALCEAHPSDDSRFAYRALRVCVRQGHGGGNGEALVIGVDGRVRLPGETADIDLSRRVPLHRILLALAHKRMAAPGEALALEELLAAGWPGEHIGDKAGANRVHVALSTLRRFGLRPFLVSGRGGYALTSACPCVLEPPEAATA